MCAKGFALNCDGSCDVHVVIQYDPLFIQIQSPKLEHIMEILRRVKSSYYSSFKDVCLRVDEGRSLLLFFFIF